jgi:RNA polymerase sigma-70 factor (ECF subfamily)
MDSAYIQRVLSGSTDDFRYIIRKYKDLAFSVAVSVVKNEFDAEEVVQEAFIKAFQNLASFRGKSDFKTWFYRILVNEAFKRIRKTKPEMILIESENVPDPADISDSFRGLNEEEQKLLVSESLQRIPPKECLILRLFYFEGSSLIEISNITGWSEGNVKVMLHRARKHLLNVVIAAMQKELITVKNELR